MRKERPILFNADMVRALLDGRKTQTRRIMKSQPTEGSGLIEVGTFAPIVIDRKGEQQPGPDTFGAFSEDGEWGLKCPYGQPGDQLWVREAHALLPRTAYRASVGTGTIEQVEHPTDGYTAAVFREGFDRSGAPKWRPSIHMPRWASRITLEIASIRVERLKAISEENAKAEGVRFTDFGTFTPKGAASLDMGETYHPFKPAQHLGYHVGDVSSPSECHGSARGAFAGLWAAINGADSWNANPWVWVVEFKRVENTHA